MNRLLHTLREKPYYVRQRFAFLTAAGVAGVIGLIWMVSYVGSATTAFRETQDSLSKSGLSSSFSSIGDGISGIGNNLAGVGDAVQGLPSDVREERSDERARSEGDVRVEVVDKGGVPETISDTSVKTITF